MSSFRLLSQQVFLVGFGVFELFFFPSWAEFFVLSDPSPPSLENRCVTIYKKKMKQMKERKASTIQRSTRSATRSPTRSLTRTRTRCPTRGFRIPVVQRTLVTNKQSSQVAYTHLIPYIPEVQIVHNGSPETTNY